MKKQRGFTLVELLVVIAIIGILTSVVLVSVSTANKRGKDTAVQANLSEVRAQAQMYYNDNSSYCVGASCAESRTNCLAANNGGNVFSNSKVSAQTVAAELANLGTLSCVVTADGADYVISSKLSDGVTYYCVDSNGVGVRSQTALSGTATACP
jgi:prepilin-type N-terminal cleavage/methylation domain-containing protein